ncbi:unnamed protein product [Trichogramma brassicae]|uniref:Uncharacterized protein n=1 Tax=Trichogramma brassicae TaxID=86971 RepID=A0A6H5ISP1_9HYME|nr:unnamed protein product [Trichogramma brassicae]
MKRGAVTPRPMRTDLNQKRVCYASSRYLSIGVAGQKNEVKTNHVLFKNTMKNENPEHLSPLGPTLLNFQGLKTHRRIRAQAAEQTSCLSNALPRALSDIGKVPDAFKIDMRRLGVQGLIFFQLGESPILYDAIVDCRIPFFQSRLLRGHTLLASPPELDIFFRTRCLVPSCECGSRFCRRWQVPSLLCRLHLVSVVLASGDTL